MSADARSDEPTVSRFPAEAARSDDPHALFESWLAEARESEPNDPEAMCLATADMRGRPSVRMVLLKGHDERGFVFYTNVGSRKGGELSANPRASLLFHWKSLRRQVRIEGSVSPVGDAEADAYHATRSRDSQIGAWASSQSEPLDARAVFEARVEEIRARFDGVDVPRPPFWSGYRVAGEKFEFWRDGAHRLHERRTFTRARGLAPGTRGVAPGSPRGTWSEGLLYP